MSLACVLGHATATTSIKSAQTIMYKSPDKKVVSGLKLFTRHIGQFGPGTRTSEKAEHFHLRRSFHFDHTKNLYA
jgi:hypothetical protein